ncbi:MAG: hypothetical protein CR988_02830 [Treponema sp.]|nr:MAG: hypothetical protein CR988_02830 [Treponema sp.]
MSKQNIHDDVIKTNKQSNLFLRLLKYAKPYALMIAVAVLCIIIATVLRSFTPRILQITIDEYLTGYKKTMIETPYNAKPDIVFRGVNYTYTDIKNTKETFSEDKYILHNNIKNNKWYFGKVDDKIENCIEITNDEYQMFRKKDKSGVKTMALLFIATILGVAVFSLIQEFILNKASQKIIFNIRNDIFNHIKSRAVSYFDKNPIGRLVTRVTNDTQNLNEMYINVLSNIATDVFTIISIMIMMIYLNIKLALVSFAVVPFICLFAMVFRHYIRKVNRIAKAQIAKINSALNEYITGMKVIQIFKREKKVFAHFDGLNKGYFELNKQLLIMRAAFRPMYEILRSLALVSIIYVGVGDAIKNIIPFGVFYAFTEYIRRFFQPIINLTQAFDIIQNAMSSSERIFTVLDDKTEIKNPEHSKLLENNSEHAVKGKIEFKNVSFSYDGKTKVLKNISFIINPGESFAFVGATGAGKSSIMNLITRFYDCDEGEILIDDINIKEIDKSKLRKIIATVQQDVFIFTGTIKDNIVLENKTITDEEVIRVAEYVNASKFIEKLPKAYDEPVVERGANLSNGERQLLSFARTLASKPKILILDEATSSVDTETEVLIQDALAKILKEKTAISVAHRLSTIKNADKIIVLHKGEIIESGKHDELLNKKGMYYNLYKLQYKDDEF